MLKSALDVRFGMLKTDKAVLNWDGEAELEAGDEVYIFDEAGEAQPAANGDYVTEAGKTIHVVDGKVSAIVDPKAEVAEEAETPKETTPKSDPTAALNELLAIVEAQGNAIEVLKAEVEELKKILAEIKGEPVGDPAEDGTTKEEPLEEGTALARMRYLRRR